MSEEGWAYRCDAVSDAWFPVKHIGSDRSTIRVIAVELFEESSALNFRDDDSVLIELKGPDSDVRSFDVEPSMDYLIQER